MNSTNLTYRKLPSFLTTFALVVLLVTATFAHGAASPFAALSGAWSGAGTITLADGAKERVRCRADYDVESGGASLKLSLRCAGDSFKFELQSNVSHSNGQLSGFWSESTKGAGGTIAGKASAERIEARVDGTISALLAVSTRAGRQVVSIKSPGGPMSAVAISLSRGSR
jgi:hypothetical protein